MKRAATIIGCLACGIAANAQPGIDEINGMAGDFRANAYPAIQGLCFAIGLITGIIGGLRIYIKWNVHGHRHHHIDAEIIGWMGSSIFLLLAALLMQMFNGG